MTQKSKHYLLKEGQEEHSASAEAQRWERTWRVRGSWGSSDPAKPQRVPRTWDRLAPGPEPTWHLVPKIVFVKRGIGKLQLVAQVGSPLAVGLHQPELVATLEAE